MRVRDDTDTFPRRARTRADRPTRASVVAVPLTTATDAPAATNEAPLDRPITRSPAAVTRSRADVAATSTPPAAPAAPPTSSEPPSTAAVTVGVAVTLAHMPESEEPAPVPTTPAENV